MENTKALTSDQLNALKETVRQRFDELYQRIGTNRQNLLNKVLMVNHQINKELAKEKIDGDYEKEILRRVRETERAADSQLPHVRKVVAPSPAASAPQAPKAKQAKESKPKESKVKDSKSKPAKKK